MMTVNIKFNVFKMFDRVSKALNWLKRHWPSTQFIEKNTQKKNDHSISKISMKKARCSIFRLINRIIYLLKSIFENEIPLKQK